MARVFDKLFLEFGAGHFRACVLSCPAGSRPEIHVAAVASSGLRRGDVMDQTLAGEALDQLLSQLERLGFQSFKNCEIVIPGSLTTSRAATASLKLHGLAVSKDHGDELRDELLARQSDVGSDVVELSIQGWKAGSHQGTDLPVGKTADILEVNAFCTTIDRQVLARFVSLCNTAGLEVTQTHSGLSSASRLIARLSPEASNRVIVDLGHSSTTGVVMVGHRANATFTIKAGAHHITKDIAAALSIDSSESERLKRSFGLQFIKSTSQALLPPSSRNQSSAADVPTSNCDIYPWAAPRVAEIFSLAFRHFAIYAKALDGGMILLGGGSLTLEICPFLSAKLSGVKVTRFKPTKESLAIALGLSIYHADETSLSGCEGLLEAASEAWRERDLSRRELSKKAPPFLRPLLSWFTDLSK